MNLQQYYETEATPLVNQEIRINQATGTGVNQSTRVNQSTNLILFLTNFILNLCYIYFLISNYVYIKKSNSSPMLAVEFIICEAVFLVVHICVIAYLTKQYHKYTYDSMIFVCDFIVKFPMQTYINIRIIECIIHDNRLYVMISVIALNYIQDIVNLFVYLKK